MAQISSVLDRPLMWTTFPVILLLAEALQCRAENITILETRANLTQDAVFEEYGSIQTTLVARNPPQPTGFLNRINPFRSRPQHEPPPPYEIRARPQYGVVVVPLKMHPNSYYRLASIKIGRPGYWQEFEVVVHTESPCFWAAYNPTSREGKPKARRRTCFSRLPNEITVTGKVHMEDISVGANSEMIEEGMVLSARPVGSGGYDGELGLALPPIFGNQDEESFVTSYISKRFLVPVFALHLTSFGGELHIGRPIEEYYHEIEYHSVTKMRNVFQWQSWQIGNAVIGLNGNEEVLSKKLETVFDSTMPYIFGPSKQVKKIYQAIRMHNRPMIKGYQHAFPCDTPVHIHFKWGNGNEWSLSPEKFNMGVLSSAESNLCNGVIKGSRTDGLWVLGTVFMESVYLVFEGSKYPRVGLGSLQLQPPPYEIPSYETPSG